MESAEVQLELPLPQTNKCALEDCTSVPEVVIGLQIFPPKSVMEFYKTNAPLTRMIMGLKVCRSCCSKLTFKDVITPEHFLPICKMVEKANGTAVDVEATKLVPVEFDDPEYLLMQQQRPPAGADPSIGHADVDG